MEYTHRDIAAHLSRHAQPVVVRLGDDAGTELDLGLGHVVIHCEGRVKRGEEALLVGRRGEGTRICVAVLCPVCGTSNCVSQRCGKEVRGRAANTNVRSHDFFRRRRKEPLEGPRFARSERFAATEERRKRSNSNRISRDYSILLGESFQIAHFSVIRFGD